MKCVSRKLLLISIATMLWGLFSACDRQLARTEEDLVNSADVVDAVDTLETTTYHYEVPLDPRSPWPKFRRNALQNGRSTVMPVDRGGKIWVFETGLRKKGSDEIEIGKGIFSTAVIDGDGNVYIGSADRFFYKIDKSGNEVWRFLTGEIIDSSGLLDTKGRVVFGSGDGKLYALDRKSGGLLWTFSADSPKDTGGFINWFEGNVAIGLDGTFYVPNDNFLTYAINPDDQSVKWKFKTADQTWSLAALNPKSNRLFMGNNFLLGGNNIFCLDATDGSQIWSVKTGSTIAASPMLSGTEDGAMVVVGGFDGFLRAFDQKSGAQLWSFGSRDHLYASPSQQSDGTIIQPSADGTIYAINPKDGTVKWAFDTLEPLRSSAAIDGADNIYLGSGEGKLFVLNKDGTLRWSIQLISASRDDLNASVALGREQIVIAGETGEIFSVPYDYCLRDSAKTDSRCTIGPDEALPKEGAIMFYTTQFGKPLLQAPKTIEANQPLALTLMVRKNSDTLLTAIDSASLKVEIEPEVEAIVDVSGDRRFVTIVPKSLWRDVPGGTITFKISGNYLVELEREGLKFSGGKVGGTFEQSFSFEVNPRSSSKTIPLPVPKSPGDPSGVWELFRLAAPMPTILPSYNQIGFDSIHYLIGVVEGEGNTAVVWGIGGKLSGEENRTVVDPASTLRFPMVLRYDGGLLTMANEDGFTIEFNGFVIPFAFFRVATRLDSNGNALFSPMINTNGLCGKVQFYGQFLRKLGYCNPQTDILNVFGGAELRAHEGGTQNAPAGVGSVAFTAEKTRVVASISGSTLNSDQHNFGVLLIDDATGRPVPLNYTVNTTVDAVDGKVTSVSISFSAGTLPSKVRAYLMVDTYPAVRQLLTIPR